MSRAAKCSHVVVPKCPFQLGPEFVRFETRLQRIIAFRGRAQTRFFGEHTQGGSTVNRPFQLIDGAVLYVTVGLCLKTQRSLWHEVTTTTR